MAKVQKIDLLQKPIKSKSILEDPIVRLSVDSRSFTEMPRWVHGLFAVHHYVQSRFDGNSLWTGHQQERSVTLGVTPCVSSLFFSPSLPAETGIRERYSKHQKRVTDNTYAIKKVTWESVLENQAHWLKDLNQQNGALQLRLTISVLLELDVLSRVFGRVSKEL